MKRGMAPKVGDAVEFAGRVQHTQRCGASQWPYGHRGAYMAGAP